MHGWNGMKYLSVFGKFSVFIKHNKLRASETKNGSHA